MIAPMLWWIAAGPLAIALTGAFPGPKSARTPASVNRLALAAAALAILTATVTALAVAIGGPLRTETLGAAGIGLSFYLDSLSAAMFCLVSFIGLIVIAYSRNYMDGDRRQITFTRFLCLTLASVLLLIVSGNLLSLVFAWIATSLGLHELLVFYPERPAAVIAARKKFVVSRLGDLCLLGAMALIYRQFASLDYATIFAGSGTMRVSGDVPGGMHLAAVLLVGAALLKSAQFPTHGWLIEVMETPTPVSALLHAGIINAGGFLVLRLSNVIALSVPSLEVLAIVGGITALFGSVVMLTQTSVKVSLAYSTIAQMGFMMLECGLAAFPAALLHIIAHSLYKAHAFLSSGSVIDIARASWTPSPGGKPHPARMLFAIAGVLAIALAVSRVFGAAPAQQPGVFALGAVLLLSVIHLVANGIDERPNFYVVARTFVYAGVVGTVYFALQFAAERLFGGSFPADQALHGPVAVGIAAFVVLSFAVVVFLQGLVPRGDGVSQRWQALYAHVSNGFYVNTVANRLVLRFWPSPPPEGSVNIIALPGGHNA
jgi:NAD(P)H-quinone oxidoreductase subunit 5